jgi:hypothetical protein
VCAICTPHHAHLPSLCFLPLFTPCPLKARETYFDEAEEAFEDELEALFGRKKRREAAPEAATRAAVENFLVRMEIAVEEDLKAAEAGACTSLFSNDNITNFSMVRMEIAVGDLKTRKKVPIGWGGSSSQLLLSA